MNQSGNTSINYMSDPTNQKEQIVNPITHSRQIQLQHQVSFNSVPFALTLESKQIELRKQMSSLSPSQSFNGSSLIQKYKLSYGALTRYSSYLDFQLGKAAMTKLLLRQIISNQYHSRQKSFKSKELSLLFFFLNTIQYLQIKDLIRIFDLQCEQYSIQTEFRLPKQVIKVNQMLPIHIKSLQDKKKLYLSKFTKFNAIYSQNLLNRVSQLRQALSHQQKNITESELIQIFSSMEKDSFPSIQSLVNFYKASLQQIKARVYQVLSQTEEKQLKSLYILEYLIKQFVLVDDLPYNNDTYLRQIYKKLMSTEIEEMRKFLFGLEGDRQKMISF